MNLTPAEDWAMQGFDLSSITKTQWVRQIQANALKYAARLVETISIGTKSNSDARALVIEEAISLLINEANQLDPDPKPQ